MIQRGKHNDLTVERLTDDGAWLGPDPVFLPAAQVPEGLKPGDSLRVFVYADPEGRPLATTETPVAEVGEFACLEVVDAFEHGSFLDWGLGKDLFVPWSRQHDRVQIGQRVVVAIHLDALGRVTGATHLQPFLSDEVGGLRPGRAVHALVYGFNEHGALAVVDGRYAGLIYATETYEPLEIGHETAAWIRKIRSDGKLDLSLQRPGLGGIEDAREVVLERLRAEGGFLPLTDKSAPEAIREALQMSKKAFKRAIGGLYKDGLVDLEEAGIRLR